MAVTGVVKHDLTVSQIFVEFLQYVSLSHLHNMRLYSQRFIPGAVKPRPNYEHQSKEIKRILALDADYHPLLDYQNCIITIVIPTYNEEASIVSTIRSIFGTGIATDHMKSQDLIEIIVSDGGSSDNTISVCRSYLETLRLKSRYYITTGGTNRAESQNIGAKESTGDIILFLHADSILPDNWPKLVRSAMSESKNLAGCFEFQLFLSDDITLSANKSFTPTDDNIINENINERKQSFSLNYLQKCWQKLCIFMIEWGTNIRSHYFRLPYGDQALFFRKSVFLDCFHGFQSTPLLEDYDLVRTVRKYGNIVTVSGAVKTSARRWEKNGFIWNTFLNQLIIIGHKSGVPYSRLAMWYYGLTKKKQY